MTKWQPILFNPMEDGRLLSSVRPLNLLQREVWSAHMYCDEVAQSLNEIFALRIRGPLQLKKLQLAIQDAVAAIPALQCTISPIGDFLCQQSHVRPDIMISEIPQSLEHIRREVADSAEKIFDLSQDCLVKYHISKVSDDDYVLAQISHHIIADGWSCIKAIELIISFYEGQKDLEKTCAKIASADIDFYRSNAIHLKKWVERLQSYKSSIRLPRIAKHERNFAAVTHTVSIEESELSQIKKAAARQNSSLMAYLLANFHWSVSEFCQQENIAIGIPFAQQLIQDEHWHLSHQTSLLPTTTKLTAASTFANCLQQVKEALLFARDHSQTSIGDIVSHMQIPRNTLEMPIVNVVFNFDPSFTIPVLGCNTAIVNIPKNYETYEIFICVVAERDSLAIEVSYDKSLYAQKMIQDLFEQYQQVIRKSLDNTNFRLDTAVKIEPQTDSPVQASAASKAATRKDKQTNDSGDLLDNPDAIAIKTIWQDFLDLPEIALDDDFFLLGGHSLLAAQIIAKINADLNLKLRVNDILKHSSLDSFLESCLGIDFTETYSPDAALPPTAEIGPARVVISSLQRQMWLTEHMFAKARTALHHLPSAWVIDGAITYEVLSKAFNRFVENHDLMRANFRGDDLKDLTCEILPYHADTSYLKHMPAKTPPLDKSQLIEKLQQRKISLDLSGDALFIAEFYPIDAGQSIFFFAAHHIIWDGWCFDLLLDHLNQELLGRASQRPDASFAAIAEQQIQQQHPINEQYWTERLTPKPDALDIACDNARPAVFDFSARHHLFTLDGTLTAQIEEFAGQNRTTSFTILFAAYSLLLKYFSGQDDMIIAIPNRRRETKIEEGIVGPFISNLPIRIAIDESLSFTDFIRSLHLTILEDFDHSELSIDDLFSKLKMSRDESRNQLFSAQFSYQDTRNRPEQFGSYHAEQVFIPHNALATDLLLWAKRDKDRLVCGFDYYARLWHEQSIRSFEEALTLILQGFLASGSETISSFSFQPKAPQRPLQFIQPTELWWQFFAESIAKHPNRPALQFKTTVLTYSTLDSRIMRKAEQIRSLGAIQRDFIGVAMARSDEMIITILAILRLGAAYVPLDPKFPDDRLAYMIEQSQMKFLIYSDQPYSFSPVNQYCLDGSSSQNLKSISHLDLPEVNLNDPAYVIYTSGSTGKPKGVVISHRALSNFIKESNQSFRFSCEDRLLAITTISFDISVLEIFLPLAVGGKIELAATEDSLDGGNLIAKYEASKPTWLQATPATWTMLFQAGWQGDQNLRAITGGEPLSIELARKLTASTGRLLNAYGPTEATVWATLAEIDDDVERIHIGRAISNYETLLLDHNLHPTPQGMPSRLFLAGPSLASCYLHRQDLTDERFLSHPAVAGSLIYDTGDLVRRSGSGELIFLGRRDSQVKVRGFRIELGEIESAILSHTAIDQVAVIVREDEPGDQKIVAYLHAANEIRIGALNKFLSQTLPRYMLPNAVVNLDSFPLTGSGKVDRKNLPQPTPGPRPSHLSQSRALSTEEAWLRSNWGTLTGSNEIGLDDNFFAIGGHSIGAVQCLADIKSQFSTSLEIRDLMTGTLENVASKIVAASHKARPETKPPNPPDEDSGRSPVATGSLWSKLVQKAKR